MQVIDWVRGDALGLDLPAHQQALKAAGPDYLTRAFRASGIIDDGNAVVAITRFEEVRGGSTGRKLLLSVAYAEPEPRLHTDLFVKFSRDFDNEVRDAARIQMELEVHLALLSRDPNFPIAVPVCYYSDYHHDSGTGILITQCIPYDRQGVEKHYPKGLDYQMPDQLGHYQALIRSLGRLAGTHKAGKLSADVERFFPFEPEKLDVSARRPFTPEEISQKVAAYAEFATSYPQLIPENIRSAEFLQRLASEAPRFQALQDKINPILKSQPELIALCHWNAHVDNAWFWRDDQGQIECGLMDWGNVSQMNMAMAIWGCLSAAEVFIWDEHLDELLNLFIAEFRRIGGGDIDHQDIKRDLIIYVGMMGLAWMLDMPLKTLSRIPDLEEVKDRFDPRIENNERARAQILIMTAFLNLWEKSDMEAIIRFMADFPE